MRLQDRPDQSAIGVAEKHIAVNETHAIITVEDGDLPRKLNGEPQVIVVEERKPLCPGC